MNPPEARQPVMILIPGLGSDAWVYSDLEKHLEGKARPILFRVPGMAGAPPCSGPVVAESLDRLRLLVGEQSGPVFIVGHSLGGALALALATEAPPGLAGLVILDAGPRPVGEGELPGCEAAIVEAADDLMPAARESASGGRLAEWIGTMVLDEGHRDRIVRDFMSSDPASLRDFFINGRMLQHRIRADRIRIPVLAVVACEDEHQCAEHVADFSERYRHTSVARIVPVSPARHFVMLDRPADTAGHILRFVQAQF